MSAPTSDVPEKPRDRYVTVRRVLHAVSFVVATAGILWWLPWPAWGIVCAVCETVAFTLRPQSPDDQAQGVLESGMQIGCGAAFGCCAGMLWAFTHLNWNNTGDRYFASGLVGAVVGAFLALRFGDKFWNWVMGGRNPW